jgi:hypothetical protein
MRALAKKPDDRFQTARDFRKELELAVKDADVGKAETLRMSRDAIAQARTHSGGQQRSQAIAPAKKPATPAPPPASDERPESIADALEPGVSSTSAARASKTPWLLIGLGGAVVVAGAVVAALMLGGGKKPHAKKPPPPQGSDGSAAHGPFLPPEVSWTSQQAFPDRDLDVRCAGVCDPAAVAATLDDAFARFRAFAAKHKAGETVAAQPLTLLVIPARVLCDARVYETGHAPDNCAQESYYYRPLERTLLVVDDTAHLRANLSAALAEAICVHQPNLAACESIDRFAKESAGSSH